MGARYTTGSPVLPAGWANWTVWQYSGTGTVTGIATPATDLDQANPAFLSLLDPGTQDQVIGAPAGFQLRQAIPAPGQTVSYTATGLPPGVSPSRRGNLTGWLTRAGSYSVQVSASDAAGPPSRSRFSWTVTAATGQGPAGPVRFGVGGKCLSDVGNRSASGTPVALGSCSGSAAQWTAAADRPADPRHVPVGLRVGQEERGQGSAGTVRGLRQPAVGRRFRRASGQRRRRAVPDRISQWDQRQPGSGARVLHHRLGQPGLDAARRAGAGRSSPARGVLAQEASTSGSAGGGDAPRAVGWPGSSWTAQPTGPVRQAGQCLEVAGAGYSQRHRRGPARVAPAARASSGT